MLSLSPSLNLSLLLSAPLAGLTPLALHAPPPSALPQFSLTLSLYCSLSRSALARAADLAAVSLLATRMFQRIVFACHLFDTPFASAKFLAPATSHARHRDNPSARGYMELAAAQASAHTRAREVRIDSVSQW